MGAFEKNGSSENFSMAATFRNQQKEIADLHFRAWLPLQTSLEAFDSMSYTRESPFLLGSAFVFGACKMVGLFATIEDKFATPKCPARTRRYETFGHSRSS